MYSNRNEAGRTLAGLLAAYRGRDALVLCLPRGGVEVGFPIAEALKAELDVLVVRKLGAPANPEFGIGAIASYGGEYLNEEALVMLEVTHNALVEIEQRERAELRRREEMYRSDRAAPRIKGRTVILVDDGVATGGTAIAAIQAIRRLKPKKLIMAVPVSPPDTAQALKELLDEFICPLTPLSFAAVGQWYRDFSQTTDGRVLDLLEKARGFLARPRA